MLGIVVLVVAGAYATVFGALCGWLAEQKGRSSWGWWALGLLLGVVALIVLAVSPANVSVQDERSEAV